MNQEGNIVFKTQYLQYVISKSGWNQSVADLGSGVEYCRQPGRYPFVSFGGGTAGRPRGVVRKGNWLHVAFEQRGAEAVIEVIERPHYLSFELKELKGIVEPVFELASLGLAVTEHVGKWFNVGWNRTFGVCLLALNLKTQSFADTMHEPVVVRPVMTVRTHAGLGHVGGKYALVGAPRGELENVIAEVAGDHGLPAPTDEHGVPMKKSYRKERSYLFLMHMGKRHENLSLELARKGGFGLIMSDNYWTFSSYGSYPFRKDQWPGGEKQYIAWTERCHKAGLGVGLHCLSSCVAENDPLVIEGTKNGFVPDGGNILAADISAKARSIPVALPAYGALAGGIFRIGDELVRVGDSISMSQIAASPPPATVSPTGGRQYVLAPVARGIGGTRAVSHKKGSPMVHFRAMYGFCPDMDGPVASRIAARLAEIMNRCRMDMVYLDGLEGVHGLSWHNCSRFMLDLYNRLDRHNVIFQASTYEHFCWHILTRANSGDTAVGFDETPAEHVRAKEIFWMQATIDNLLTPVHDWHGWNFRDSDIPMGVILKATEATTLRDWAIYLESARRLDVPLGVLAGVPDFQKNPDSQKMLAMTREYEQDRIRRLYGLKI
jgi:hypothetical protein